MSSTSNINPSRRDFMRTTGATLGVASVFTIGASANAQKNEKLKVGLIGCGGRGSGAIVEAVSADPDTEIFALGDTFMDQVDAMVAKLEKSRVAEKLNVDPEHKFDGFDNYKNVIDSCDVVVLASPPAFRPIQLAYAVEQGKHVFCEKPIAVDPAGVRSVMETCKKAEAKGINIVSGLCYRYSFAKQDTIQRIQDGVIGDIMTMQTTYNTGGLWHKGREDKWSDMEYQIRNWLYFSWLSGDHINEQHIHSLDKIGWVMGNVYPDKVTASGGRISRTDEKYGNIYDHFNSVYEWDNGVKAFSSCRQIKDTSTDVSDYIYGTNGTAQLQAHTIEYRSGKTWAHTPTKKDNMYQNEHDALFAAIRSGETINNGEYMCNSTLMAIMARMSAYTGKTVTRQQALESKLDMMPKQLAWAENAVDDVAIPGTTQLV